MADQEDLERCILTKFLKMLTRLTTHQKSLVTCWLRCFADARVLMHREERQTSLFMPDRITIRLLPNGRAVATERFANHETGEERIVTYEEPFHNDGLYSQRDYFELRVARIKT